jgi:hypothetical protein
VPRNSVRRTRYDIPLRAAAALVVAAVTTASHWIGSFASGVFAVFPIVLATFVVMMHPRAGGKAAAASSLYSWACRSDFSECIISPGGSARGGRSLPTFRPSPKTACRATKRPPGSERRALGRAAVTAAHCLTWAQRYFSIESFCSRITLAHLRVSALM